MQRGNKELHCPDMVTVLWVNPVQLWAILEHVRLAATPPQPVASIFPGLVPSGAAVLAHPTAHVNFGRISVKGKGGFL